MRSICVLCLTLLTLGVNSQRVVIAPELPERGQAITISFFPAASGDSVITQKDSSVQLVFTYSNFYDQPYRVPMIKKNGHWETSFQLARYATFATFTLESGSKVQKLAADKHYPIAVYDKGKRVPSGYLYESYSLGAQMGKDTRLPAMQATLLQKELELHPDNYEAKVQLLNNKMKQASGSEKEGYRQQALDVIAANFYQQPGNPGLMNKTTMGYLMIGEKTKVDSIRNVIKVKYPETEAGYDMRISEVRQIKNIEERKNKAERMLKTATKVPANYVTELHELLLEYYAGKNDKKKVLYHLNKLPQDTSPYRGETLLTRAQLLLNNNLLLDTALAYTQRANAIAASFPVGTIRYFPETGHILPYVDPATKKEVELTAKANSLSLMSLILLQKGDTARSNQTMSKALGYAADGKTLENAGLYYRKTADYAKAYQLTKQRALNNQEDTLAAQQMEEDYKHWKKTAAGWDQEMQEVKNHWKAGMLAKLKKERINKPAPEMNQVVNLNGEPVSPSSWAGKIVVVDFWATWCVPCMKEMPYLQKVYDKYKNNPNVVFMILNGGSGNTLEDAKGWSGNKTYTFPVYFTNDRTLSEKFGFNVIPATFVIDPSGNVQFKTIGFEGASIEYKLDAAIELLLAEKESK